MRNSSVVIFLGILLYLSWAGSTYGQAEQNKEPAVGISPMFWSVEVIMDQYVKAVTRHYNLTEDQEEYTRKLMTRRVKGFLNEYEKEIRPLLAELYDYYLQQNPPSPEVAKEFSRRASPLLAAIRKEVLEGNKVWRDILDDEQRTKHDRDIEAMRKQFDQYEHKLERWTTGDVRPTDLAATVSRGARRVGRSEDAWQYYVRHFIQSYGLDAGQKQTAFSILLELRQEAARYRQKHSEEFTKMQGRFAEISRSSRKTDPTQLRKSRQEIIKLNQRRQKLERPISVDLFNQLKARLEKIPTVEQRKARQEKLDKLNAIRGARRGRGVKAATRPASTTTQPVTTTTATAP